MGPVSLIKITLQECNYAKEMYLGLSPGLFSSITSILEKTSDVGDGHHGRVKIT
jgi:hypothetical protein